MPETETHLLHQSLHELQLRLIELERKLVSFSIEMEFRTWMILAAIPASTALLFLLLLKLLRK